MIGIHVDDLIGGGLESDDVYQKATKLSMKASTSSTGLKPNLMLTWNFVGAGWIQLVVDGFYTKRNTCRKSSP